MQSRDAQLLLSKFAAAMVYIAVEEGDGTQSIGSAFHVGEGVFVTARHVIEHKKIIEIRATEPIRVPVKEAIPEYSQEAIDKMTEVHGTPPTWPEFSKPFRISDGPVFHADDRIDLAAFRLSSVHQKMPFVRLGSHLDDWILRNEWRLSDALILGYPPIPLTTSPELVAARAEINSVSWLHKPPIVTFILSAMPRGGFSGGLALHEHGFALGVIAQSLVADERPAELGYLAVISVEAIYVCLADNKMLPEVQKEQWGEMKDIWNTESTYFVLHSGLMVASVNSYDDGKRFYFDVSARDKATLDSGLQAGLNVVGKEPYEKEVKREDWIRIHLRGDSKNIAQLVEAARSAAESAIEQTPGLTKIPLKARKH